MAITTTLYGPLDHNPHIAKGEMQWVKLVSDASGGSVRVFTGNGEIGRISVLVGAAGATVDLHDADADDTLDVSNRLIRGSAATTGTPNVMINLPILGLQKGLAIVISAHAIEVLVGFWGRVMVSPRTFGTQLDGNAGRASGTSTDKAMAN